MSLYPLSPSNTLIRSLLKKGRDHPTKNLGRERRRFRSMKLFNNKPDSSGQGASNMRNLHLKMSIWISGWWRECNIYSAKLALLLNINFPVLIHLIALKVKSSEHCLCRVREGNWVGNISFKEYRQLSKNNLYTKELPINTVKWNGIYTFGKIYIF